MCYATFVFRNLLFVSFQIISRIMRCFQFIKLGTASLTNNIHDIVRIISVCGYIFRQLIVHVAKFPTRKTVIATKPSCHRSTRCVFQYFFEQCLLFQTSSFYCPKVFHRLPKTWNGLFTFRVIPKLEVNKSGGFHSGQGFILYESN